MTSARYHGSSPLRYTSDVDLAKVAVPGICLAADLIVKVRVLRMVQAGKVFHLIAVGSGVLHPYCENIPPFFHWE